jgi:Carboxypeptidase regulatory-like domain
LRASRWVTLLLAINVIAATTMHAQGTNQVRVRLQMPDGTAISGALVALLDARDSVVAEGLSTEAGTRALRVPTGAYRLRVRRIGYLPYVSSGVTVPHEGEVVLRIESPRVALQGIVVNSKSHCTRSDPDARPLATVWEEIDKALKSSQLTLDDLAGIGRARIYRKEVASNGPVISADTNVFQIGDRRPFGAIDPESLARNGYVIGDEQKGWHYFAPDDVVLLSEQFANTHCFRLVREPSRPGEIGVSFEPAPERKLADVEGVLWVDEATSELREIVFHFANAKAFSRFGAGGFTHFRRMASGSWIVDAWELSAPRLELRQSQGSGLPGLLVSIGRIDNGGGILDNTRPNFK